MKDQGNLIYRIPFIIAFCLLFFLPQRLHASPHELIQEHIFLIDTSSSMNSNKLLSPLRVAVDDYADTIPIDGASRIWICTFSKGLKKDFLHRLIAGAKDLTAAKVFLNSIEATGSATYIYKALDEVFDQIEKTLADGKSHDFVIHLFTDGADNGPGNYSFEKNVSRFRNIRNANKKLLELHYHALGIEVSQSMKEMIQATEGMYLLPGIEMPPRPDFELPTSATYDNIPVTFVNKTIGKADGWHWDFGDGTTGKEKDPTHTFSEPGEYTVQLTAVSDVTRIPMRRTVAKRITISGGPPVAKFTKKDPDKPKYEGEVIHFVDQSVGKIQSWSWDFGDNRGKSSVSNPEYVFEKPGTYQVTLKLKGVYGDGPDSACSEFITISPRPTLIFTYFPENPKQGEKVKFSNESSGYKEWQWDFGDGTKSAIHSPEHTYQKDGTYQVTLQALNTSGKTETTSKTIVILSKYVPPKAKFTLPVKTINIGESIELVDQSEGTIEIWKWDMGDGTILEGNHIKHTYMKGGAFTIRLTVTGPAGADSVQIEIVVRKVLLKFSYKPEQPKRNEPVVIVNESEGSFSDWQWDFGDGETSKKQNPDAHTFKNSGTYTVRLMAKGPDGQRHSAVRKLQVFDIPPTAKFTLTVESIEVHTSIKIIDQSTGTIDTWKWDMGDGTILHTRNVVHTYTQDGSFTITLTVSNQGGQSHAYSLVILVTTGKPPELNFHLASGTNSRSRPPLTVRVQNNSTGSIRSYLWDFGDGATSDDIQPEHLYEKHGKYVITLKVTDHKGREYHSTSSQAIIITVLPPPIVPRRIQFIAALALYGVTLVVCKMQKRHKRNFRYQINSDNKVTYRDPARDKKFLWRDGEYLTREDNDFTDGFLVRMSINWLLQKRYYFEKIKGDCIATRRGKPLEGKRLVNNAEVVVGGTENIRFLKFNDSVWTGILGHLCILAFVGVALFFGLRYLG